MNLSALGSVVRGVIVKVSGHGSFRKRIVEMGFVRGNKVKVILNAPLRDPIEYEIIGYKISRRREEASKIEVISEAEAKKFLTENFGFWENIKVSGDQTARLERSWNEFKEGKSGADRLCNTVKHIISECALIGWQSGGHSNGYVPAFAIGAGAELFHGRFDNTEISKKIAKAAGWEAK